MVLAKRKPLQGWVGGVSTLGRSAEHDQECEESKHTTASAMRNLEVECSRYGTTDTELRLCCGARGIPGAGATARAPRRSGTDEPTTQVTVNKTNEKGYTEKIPGTDVSFDMLPIPGGTFLMGSPKTEAGRGADEGPRHLVTVKPFWMEKTETTWYEYDCFWKVEPGAKCEGRDETKDDKKDPDAVTRPTPPYDDETFGKGRDGTPALCITHHAAMEYCYWLSKKTGKKYRLPTEAEWEWAARAGTTTVYSFGDDPKMLDDYAWHGGNSDDKTHKVATKKPNPWGLYDMYGNVSEWCLDQYQKDYYSTFSPDKPVLAPVNLPNEKRFAHVTRGGSWADEPVACRSATRRGSDPSWIKRDPQRPQSIWWLTDADFVGFRVVRAVEEQDNLKNIRSKVTKKSGN